MLSLDEVVRVTDAAPFGLDDLSLIPAGVSTDSRTLEQGELFIALNGPNFDGHAFVPQALEKGAVAAIVSQKLQLPRTIQVKDTLEALGEIALYHRTKLDIPVVVISGTNGKTTVKNLLRDLLSVKYKTYANSGNRNNLIGLPLSLLEIDASYEIAVLEAGISKKGELTRLAEIAQPAHGLLTNIGPGHLEGLGTVGDVLEAKWELVEAIARTKGNMYLNADYPEFIKKAQSEGVAVKTFSLKEPSDFRPTDVKYTTKGTDFYLHGQGFHLPLLGAGNLSNAVAAIALATGDFQIPLTQAAEIVREVRPEKWRLEYRRIGEVNLLLDCYNANPVSMREALGILTLFSTPRIALLGAMLELGSLSNKYHHEILELARDTADLVIITGPYSELYPRHEGVLFIPDKHKAAEELHKRLVAGASVLVKGSRGCALEDVAAEVWGNV